MKIVLVLSVIVALVAAERLGVWRQFGNPALARRTLIDLGTWGYVAFILAYTTLQPFGIPGTAFVVAASLVWPWPTAFALSMVGTLAASVVGFSFARFVARDWVSPRIPEQFKKYDDALAVHAFATVFLLRLIFWMPPLLHAFFGLSKVRFSTHFWGSAAGYVLPLFVVSYFGQRLFDAVRHVPMQVWVEGAAAIVAVAAAGWAVFTARRSPSMSPRRTPPPPR